MRLRNRVVRGSLMIKSPQLINLVADRFAVLSDPTRIQLLNLLYDGEKTVTQLIDASGFRQAKVSKHLQVLHKSGFIDRRKEGLHVFYRITNDDVFLLCDIMCKHVQHEADELRTALEEVISAPVAGTS